MSFLMACYKIITSDAQFDVQRNNALEATIPHTENKPRASNANPSAALLFFEVEVEDAADPLAVPLPDVPLAVPCGAVEEGLAVGAGDAT
jgi:sortase (surface protein transpeptidase)